MHRLYVHCREQGVGGIVHDLWSFGGDGFLKLALEVGSTDSEHDASRRLSCRLRHGNLVVEHSLLMQDASSLDLFLLNVMDVGVEVDQLLMHLI